jgi:hypothetical protein
MKSQTMIEHVRRYSKAYSGGTAAVAADQLIVDKVTVILMWMLSLTGVTPPAEVNQAIEGLLVFAATTFVVAIVPKLSAPSQPGDVDSDLPRDAAPVGLVHDVLRAASAYNAPPRLGPARKPVPVE